MADSGPTIQSSEAIYSLEPFLLTFIYVCKKAILKSPNKKSR